MLRAVHTVSATDMLSFRSLSSVATSATMSLTALGGKDDVSDMLV